MTHPPDYETVRRVEHCMHDLARELGMTMDELLNAVVWLQGFRDWSRFQDWACRQRPKKEE